MRQLLVFTAASFITPATWGVTIGSETNESADLLFYGLIIFALIIALSVLGYVFFTKHTEFSRRVHEINQHNEQLVSLCAAIEQSRTSIMIVDKEGDIVYVNPQFSVLTGYTKEEVIGQNPRFLQSGHTPQDTYKRLWRTLTHGETWVGEFINKKKNGEIFWEQAYISPVFSEDRKLSQYVAVKIDITDRRRRELHERGMRHVLELVSHGAPLHTILEAIVRGAENEYPDIQCSILLLDNQGKHLLTGAAPSLPDFYSQAISTVEIGLGVGSCGTAAFTGERVIAEDIFTHPYWVNFRDLAKKANLGSCWSEPILGTDKKILGTFAIYHHEPHTPGEQDLILIESLSHLAAISIERFHAQQALKSSEAHHRKMAHHDALTGLPNRVLFSMELKKSIKIARRDGHKIGLLFIDLDNFKPVNDEYGHALGDELLKHVARRMKNAVRQSDMVCRIGGDEFIVLVPGVQDEMIALGIAEKIRSHLCTAFLIGEHRINISCSIGVSLYPDHGKEEKTLLRHADQAMYRAKDQGRNRVEMF